jgi:hypothetical protein
MIQSLLILKDNPKMEYSSSIGNSKTMTAIIAAKIPVINDANK